MTLHFLVEDADALPGGTIELTGAEAHHAAVVRRVRVGEAVSVTDGRGAWYEGACTQVDQKRVAVRVDERRRVPPSEPRIVLAQALAKGDRDELAVQAATELGIDEIVPWQAARSVSRWGGQKAEKGRLRWASIVREAAKQAHRAWLPIVGQVETTAQLAQRAAGALVLVLEPSATDRLTSVDLPDAGEIILVVGPEGGIAPEELDLLASAGASAVRLGSTVLRTSTAGPAALAVLQSRLARW